ncbi:hypothetical protein [Mycobacterium sp. shizuoka-1]|uniref:hypothetical protein n=1 Tax=Mycobacterium sp. shizuoka-1 TaxID=2039281 RepID=UPI000C05FEC8|nr:hypothetical protein [Mycobacterium sp. shizuoka-1]GAY18106.1 hypothetical protein MSZK_48320 [Mycobacterium sp. shizuoka-1]
MLVAAAGVLAAVSVAGVGAESLGVAVDTVSPAVDVEVDSAVVELLVARRACPWPRRGDVAPETVDDAVAVVLDAVVLLRSAADDDDEVADPAFGPRAV